MIAGHRRKIVRTELAHGGVGAVIQDGERGVDLGRVAIHEIHVESAAQARVACDVEHVVERVGRCSAEIDIERGSRGLRVIVGGLDIADDADAVAGSYDAGACNADVSVDGAGIAEQRSTGDVHRAGRAYGERAVHGCGASGVCVSAVCPYGEGAALINQNRPCVAERAGGGDLCVARQGKAAGGRIRGEVRKSVVAVLVFDQRGCAAQSDVCSVRNDIRAIELQRAGDDVRSAGERAAGEVGQRAGPAAFPQRMCCHCRYSAFRCW